MNSLISLIFIPRGKRKAQILKTKGSLKKKPRLGYIVEENQASESYSLALIWLSVGMDLPKWWPTERPNFLAFCSSWTSFFIKNPAWKFRSKKLLGTKYSGVSSQIFSRRFFHPSRTWSRASAGMCPMLYVSWGSKTWKPQKCRVPLWGYTKHKGESLQTPNSLYLIQTTKVYLGFPIRHWRGGGGTLQKQFRTVFSHLLLPDLAACYLF